MHTTWLKTTTPSSPNPFSTTTPLPLSKFWIPKKRPLPHSRLYNAPPVHCSMHCWDAHGLLPLLLSYDEHVYYMTVWWRKRWAFVPLIISCINHDNTTEPNNKCYSDGNILHQFDTHFALLSKQMSLKPTPPPFAPNVPSQCSILPPILTTLQQCQSWVAQYSCLFEAVRHPSIIFRFWDAYEEKHDAAGSTPYFFQRRYHIALPTTYPTLIIAITQPLHWPYFISPTLSLFVEAVW